MTTLLEALKSAQFVTDAQGQQVAMQIKPAVWKALVSWLEITNGGPMLEEPVQLPAASSEDTWRVASAAKLSELSLATVWDNSEDDIYNDL